MNKTAQEWAKTAIVVQSACNLSGVAHSFSQLMADLHSFSWDARFRDSPAPNHFGTDWCNHHPLAVLFIDKMADLCGIQRDSIDRFSWAYDWAKERSENGGDFEYIAIPTCGECGVG